MDIKNECQVCHSSISLNGHHMTYEPEFVVMLCAKCHVHLHYMAKLSPEQRAQMESWVSEYSSHWENCEEKYKKSSWCKAVQKRSNDRLNAKRMKGYYQKNKDRLRAYKQKRRMDGKDK